MPMSYPVSRRRFVARAAGLLAGAVAGPALVAGPETPAGGRDAAGEWGWPVRRPGAAAPLPPDVFTLGVASGDPTPDGVVLWTRLAPDPVHDGGMPVDPVEVAWQVAEDERFGRIVCAGVTSAEARLAHSVHVELAGLRPGREYWYRFRAGGQLSPVGRTRTAPAPGERVGRLRFAFASCQDLQIGYFTPYPHLVADDVAFVAFLGDYIYESGPMRTGVRTHEGTGEPVTLAGYRNRHAQYRTDRDLQAAHAAVPWIVTLDDHEIVNNWADAGPETFRARRVAALRAYYEHMPLRRSALPHGLELRLHRRLDFGRLVSLHVLDTRQHRTAQPGNLARAGDPTLTMTGAEQESWLTRGMRHGARWNLLANQVMWAENDRTPGPGRSYEWDCWDGYRVQRRRLLEFFGSGRTSNPVVLTGDRHATWVCDLRTDFDDPSSPVVGAEITGTSITSGADFSSTAFHALFDPIMAESPHWKYIDNRRGYMLCEVTDGALRASLRVVDTVSAPTAQVSTAARFEVVDGVPGVHRLA